MKNEWIISKASFAEAVNDAGIEMFKKGDGALSALVREDIQNSLDAVNDKENPVKVVFSVQDIPEIPGQNNLLEIFTRINNTEENKNFKNETDRNIELLNAKEITVLKVSDYNTTGAEGASKYDPYRGRTAWKAMTEIAGDTQKKSESSAGSFGIGKNANRAASSLRTLYFSTLCVGEDKVYSQGWLKYASIVEPDEENQKGFISSPSFFYKDVVDDDEHGAPIKGNLSEFESFGNRTVPGTDVFIPGIIVEDNFIEILLRAVISNFLVAIHRKLLEVEINVYDQMTAINSANLEKRINELSDNSEIKNYYRALIQDNENLVFKMPKDGKLIANENDVIFKVALGSDEEKGTRKAIQTREIGMKIYEKDRFPQGIDFSAVLLVLGKKQNEILHKIESPEHNSWDDKDRIKQTPSANELLKSLTKFMNDSIRSLLPETTDEIAAYGLENLLTNIGNSDKQKIVDRLPNSIASIEIKKTIKPIIRKKSQGLVGDSGNGVGVKKGQSTSNAMNPAKGLQKDAQFAGGEGSSSLDVTNRITNIRSKNDGLGYKILLQSVDELVNPEFEFEIVGDNSTDTKLKIVSVETSGNEILSINQNIIKVKDKIYAPGEGVNLYIKVDETAPVSFNIKVKSQKVVKHEN